MYAVSEVRRGRTELDKCEHSVHGECLFHPRASSSCTERLPYNLKMDCWWSLASEDQAVDRVHRIGQDRPVTVTKFIARNTIEERILVVSGRLAYEPRHSYSSQLSSFLRFRSGRMQSSTPHFEAGKLGLVITRRCLRTCASCSIQNEQAIQYED